jgi:hypothetical protein
MKVHLTTEFGFIAWGARFRLSQNISLVGSDRASRLTIMAPSSLGRCRGSKPRDSSAAEVCVHHSLYIRFLIDMAISTEVPGRYHDITAAANGHRVSTD